MEIESSAQNSEKELKFVETVFQVSGMDCADEVAAINSALNIEGVSEVNANIMTGAVRILHSPSIAVSTLKTKVETAGVKVNSKNLDQAHELSRLRIGLVFISGLCVGVGLLADYMEIHSWISIGLSIAAVGFSGVLVFPKAFRSLSQKRLDINVLMAFAVIGAFVIKEYSEAATVVFLFSLSELLESFSVAKARRAIREVMDLTPQVALLVLEDRNTKEVAVSNLKIGDVVVVKSGSRIPVDGVVISGNSLVNQAPLTGESIPVKKDTGDEVFAGTVNETGAMQIEVKKLFVDTKASQIVRMIEEAQKDKAPAQRFVDRFAKYYTPTIFLIAIFMFIVPPLLFGESWDEWLYRSLVLLVIACPCALVISTPVSFVSGLASMAKRGVLVKGGVFLETLGKLNALAVDKTGTITHGKPKVQKIHLFNEVDSKKVFQIAASLEVMSSHPLAIAVLEHATDQSIEIKNATNFKTVPGYGVEASIGEHSYFLGNHRFAHELGVCTPELEALLARIEEQAFSVIVVGHRPHENCQGEVLGVVTIADQVREGAKRAIESIHKAGVKKVVMLSGDNQKTATAIARQVGIDQVSGDLLPEDKVREVKKLVGEFGVVGMVGDGINDAPALAQSSLGIAMGVTGTDSALETADVALMKDDLSEVANAIVQGKRVLSVIKFNIGFSLLVKAVFLALALLGKSGLWIAVAADTGTSLLVVANALRLLRVRVNPLKS